LQLFNYLFKQLLAQHIPLICWYIAAISLGASG